MLDNSKAVRILSLLRQLTIQEIRAKYLGSVLGLFWIILVPMMTLILYSLVFGAFLKARWGAQPSSGLGSFALVLFPGLLIFNYFSECVNRAPSLVSSNPNYVKKVVFPLPLLGLVPPISALVQLAAGFGVWCLLSVTMGHGVSVRILLLPLLIAPMIALVVGVTWMLSAVSVYIKDLISFTPIATQVLMFLSPVLYPIDNVPENLRWLFLLNPLTFVVEEVRSLLISDREFPWAGWAMYSIVGCFSLWLGMKVFRLLRPGFADVV